MSDRLKYIKAMRADGVTVFCDWEKDIDWMIEQIEKCGGPYTAANNATLREENSALATENENLRLRMCKVTALIDGALS